MHLNYCRSQVVHGCRSWVSLKIILYCMAHTHTEQTGRAGTIGGSSLYFSSGFYCLPGTTDCESLNTSLSHTEETGVLYCYFHWMKPGHKIGSPETSRLYISMPERGTLKNSWHASALFNMSICFLHCNCLRVFSHRNSAACHCRCERY